VEIATRGPDLTVTARKTHVVRVNWQALHLERAQRDYQLRLRLGHGFDYNNLEARIADGILTSRCQAAIGQRYGAAATRGLKRGTRRAAPESVTATGSSAGAPGRVITYSFSL